MSTQAMRRALLLFAATALLVAGSLGAGIWFVFGYPGRSAGGDGHPVKVVLHKGEGLRALTAELVADGVVDHPFFFRIFVERTGKAGRLRPGTYTFTTAMTPREVLALLTAPRPEKEVTVTIPEGENILFVARALGKAGVAREADVLAAERDPGVARALGVPGRSLEGYLFPDTYQFRVPTPPVKALAVMVARQRKVWTALAAKYPAQLARLKKDLHMSEPEIVSLASLVQGEAGYAEDMRNVAAVFENRLSDPDFEPKLLESDPSILYGCTVPTSLSLACRHYQQDISLRHDPKIHREQVDDSDNPYNTYTHPGIPFAPIGNPGRDALLAVVSPARRDDLYFVAAGGVIYYAKTHAQQDRNIEKYLKHRQ